MKHLITIAVTFFGISSTVFAAGSFPNGDLKLLCSLDVSTEMAPNISGMAEVRPAKDSNSLPNAVLENETALRTAGYECSAIYTPNATFNQVGVMLRGPFGSSSQLRLNLDGASKSVDLQLNNSAGHSAAVCRCELVR